MRRRWTIEIQVSDRSGPAHVEARCAGATGHPLVGLGGAAGDSDLDVVWATSNALTDLGHQLLIAASAALAARTGRAVQLTDDPAVVTAEDPDDAEPLRPPLAAG